MFYSDVCIYKIVFRGLIVRSGNECPRVNTEKSGAVIIIVKKSHVELVVSRNALMSPIIFWGSVYLHFYQILLLKIQTEMCENHAS